MRALWRHVAVASILLMTATSALGEVTAIEATVSLPDRSQEAVAHAFLGAFRAALQEALARGLSWVQVYTAVVREDRLTVRVLATEVPPASEGWAEEAEPQKSRPTGSRFAL